MRTPGASPVKGAAGAGDARFGVARPRAGAAWFKAHGLGNDYVVVEEGDGWTLSPGAVRRFCHRTEGVGGDGVVVLLGGRSPGAGGAGPGAPFRLRMFNPDGGEFERSGNGLRVLAAYLHHTGRVETGAAFDVEVGGERVRMEIHGADDDGAYDISVDMGRARTGPDAVALDRAAVDEDGRIDLGDAGPVAVRTVSVGNPHAVVFTDDLSMAALERVGPRLATHAAFANGTNVQLARPAGPHRVEVAIWERGVGHTTASGTSSCAVAVAGVETGRLEPGEIEVVCEGGTLRVGVTADLDVVLRGPVRAVCEGALVAGFRAWLEAAAPG